jgi:hypothetical protein
MAVPRWYWREPVELQPVIGGGAHQVRLDLFVVSARRAAPGLGEAQATGFRQPPVLCGLRGTAAVPDGRYRVVSRRFDFEPVEVLVTGRQVEGPAAGATGALAWSTGAEHP